MQTTETPVEIRMFAWMKIEKPGMTMHEAIEELKSVGNEILEIDEEGRRIKVADVTKPL